MTLVNFTQELSCQYCRETEQLLKEVASFSDKIALEVTEFPSLAQRYQVRAVPRTVVNEAVIAAAQSR